MDTLKAYFNLWKVYIYVALAIMAVSYIGYSEFRVYTTSLKLDKSMSDLKAANESISHLEDNLDKATAETKKLSNLIMALDKSNQETTKLLEARHNDSIKNLNSKFELLKRINNANPEDDKPISPVIGSTLESIRVLSN